MGPLFQGKRRRIAVAILALVIIDAALLGSVSTRGAGAPRDPTTEVMVVLHRDGLAASLDTLENWAARDSAILRNGHQLAHALGRQAVRDGGGDAAVVRQCRPAFASGCYHGVVEASLQAGHTVDVQRLERLCLDSRGDGSPAPGYECVHGLGHGLLGATNYDIDAALRLCDALSTPALRASCHSGTFMEAISSAVAASESRGVGSHAHHMGHQNGRGQVAGNQLRIDPSDAFSPCDRYRDPYATSCWLFQGFVILRAHDFDATQALRICDGAPQGRAARCYQSVGHQLTGLFQHDNSWILERCSHGRPDLAPECAAGATLALDAMDWSGGRAMRLCGEAPSAWRSTCYRSALAALADLAPAFRRAQLCRAIEQAYAEACREASVPGSAGDRS